MGPTCPATFIYRKLTPRSLSRIARRYIFPVPVLYRIHTKTAGTALPRAALADPAMAKYLFILFFGARSLDTGYFEPAATNILSPWPRATYSPRL